MTYKPLAIIDPFTNEPNIHCFYRLTQIWRGPCLYLTPALNGLEDFSQLNELSGIIVLGSSSNIEDRFPWQTELANILIAKLEKSIPVLAICFGHQLMADAFGARVDRVQSDGEVLKGARAITWEKSILNFNAGDQSFFCYSHGRMVFDLPPSLTRLATSSLCPVESFKHNDLPLLAIQAHPEASTYFMKNDVQIVNAQTMNECFSQGGNFVKAFIESYIS